MKRAIILFLLFSTSIIVNAQDLQDTLKFKDLEIATTKPSGDYGFYITKSGTILRIGDVIKIGLPSAINEFSFIWTGDGVLAFFKAPSNYSGMKTEITKFKIAGNKRIGYSVWAIGKGPSATLPIWVGYETALSAGEIKSDVMSSDEALAELKKTKDKLDLGLIGQSEYDSIKLELIKLIK
jgi:hypothetical protein